jgi:hypothetical protein
MTSNLKAVDQSRFEKNKKRWYHSSSRAQTHFKAEYTIRFILNAAGIDSQLLFEGKDYNEPNSFEVVWQAGADIPAPKEHRQAKGFDGDRER